MLGSIPEQFWTKRTAYGYRYGDGTEVGTDQIVFKDFLGHFVTAKHYDLVVANSFTSDTKLNADKETANKNEKFTPVYIGHEFDLEEDYDLIRVALKTSNGKYVTCLESSSLNPLGVGYHVSARDE